jgi:hypothetical protein
MREVIIDYVLKLEDDKVLMAKEIPDPILIRTFILWQSDTRGI